MFVHYQYLEAAVRNALPMIDKHTMILCLQNGLGNYDEIAKVVPEEQMRNFIAVAGNEDEQVLFMSPEEVALSKGDKVRITGGVFEGVEGQLMRVKNSRGKRVVVKIDGITAVATASIPSALVEKI